MSSSFCSIILWNHFFRDSITAARAFAGARANARQLAERMAASADPLAGDVARLVLRLVLQPTNQVTLRPVDIESILYRCTQNVVLKTVVGR